MERRGIGSTGLACGVIGMGTWRTFDVPITDARGVGVRQDIVNAALQVGTDLFDSSPMYGNAEAVLALGLDGRRDRALVATKVWSPSITRGRQQVEHALKLFAGKVDVYQVHNLVAWQSYLPMLQTLKHDGRVGAVGVTHYAHSAFPELQQIMETQEIDVVQIPYNAADPFASREILPLAAQRGIGVIVMSPLGTGRLVRNPPPASELRPLAPFGVVTWAQALLKWVVSDVRVTMTIPATSRLERVDENAEAGNPPLFGPEQRDLVSWLATRYAG